MAETKSIDNLMTGFIAIIVGVVLVPIVASIVASANVTGTTATVVSLIPVFFGLAILLLTIRQTMK